MATNRKAAEEYIIKYINKLTPKTGNAELYRKRFDSMSDEEFDTYMKDLESGKKTLSIILPNFKDKGVTIDNTIKIAQELGLSFFHNLWVSGKGDTPTYMTPVKYMVIDLPVSRQSQTLVKKRSIPKDNKTVDALTGQPTGASKGAKLSYPEIQVLASMGMESSLLELVKYRGGDNKGNAVYTGMLSNMGTARLDTMASYASGVVSTSTLKTFLTSALLKSNL
jgi:hypothetical protein